MSALKQVQQFLQLNHVHCFSESYLAWYLRLSESEVRKAVEQLVDEKQIFRPPHTDYVQGFAVDWGAVHAGKLAAPRWCGRLASQ